MRQLTIGLLCGAIFLAAGCNKPQSNAPAELNASGEEASAAGDYYTVRAGPVANAKITALAGTFQMLKVSAAKGIPSDLRGGGCLVFKASDLPNLPIMAGTSCNTNTDCQTADTEYSAAYCHAETHTCWAKPKKNNAADRLCNKAKIFPVNTLNPIPADPPAPGTGPIHVSEWVKPGAKVRVVACVGKPWNPPPPPLPPCAQIDTPDRIEVMGPEATVKP